MNLENELRDHKTFYRSQVDLMGQNNREVVLDKRKTISIFAENKFMARLDHESKTKEETQKRYEIGQNEATVVLEKITKQKEKEHLHQFEKLVQNYKFLISKQDKQTNDLRALHLKKSTSKL